MKLQPTILFLSSYFKGRAFFDAAKELGCRAILLSVQQLRGKPWPPYDTVEFLPDLEDSQSLLAAADKLARYWEVGYVFPMDEEDVENAALVRHHLGLPGPNQTVAHNFRDKLRMRQLAEQNQICIPRFTDLSETSESNPFFEEVMPDWILKPRSKAGSKGISRVSSLEQLRELLGELGPDKEHYLLEQSVAGDVFHVDSVVSSGRPVFSQAHRYDTPPFEVCDRGGVFGTRSLSAEDPDLADLLALNAKVLAALQLPQGISHAEFIRCSQSGRLCFLEIAARVGGANIDVLVQKSTGVNLWREWIRVEMAAAAGQTYLPPAFQRRHGGMLNCLARMQHPDTTCLHAPEVVWQLDMDYHVGVVVVSDERASRDSVLERNQQWLSRNVLQTSA